MIGQDMRGLLSLIAIAMAGSTLVAPPAIAQSARPFRLCVVDENLLVARSPVAPRIAERFQQIRNRLQQSFQTDSAQLDADARALAGTRASLTAAEARTRDEEIARRRARLRERGEEINRNLAALDAELTKNVIQLAAPTVRIVAAERGCSAVIARGSLLDLGDSSLDITSGVLGRLGASQPG